jgi:WD40 repeat protein
VSVLKVAEDDQTLIVGTTIGHVVRWDLESGQFIDTVSRLGGNVGGLTFLSRRRIAAGTAEGAIHIWDLLDGSLLTIIEGHSGAVNDVVAVGDGTGLVSAGDDGAVRRWSLPEFVEGAPLGTHTAEVTSVRFHPSGRRLASAGRDGLIQVWDLAQHALVVKLVGHKQSVEAIAFSPDGSRLVSSGFSPFRGGGLRVWDVDSGITVLELADRPFGLTINALAFRPDGKVIAGASSYRDEVFFWDAETGVLIDRLTQSKKPTSVRFKTQRFVGINSLAYFHEGKKLAAAGPWGVRVWNLSKGEIAFNLEVGEIEVNDVAVTPDGIRIVGALADGGMAVWNLPNRKPSMVLLAHEGPTFRVAVDRTGQLAVSGGEDGWLKVWNLNEGTELYARRGHRRFISSLAMHPDGKSVASGSYDTTVRRWTVVPVAEDKNSRFQPIRFVGLEVEYLPPVPTLFAPRASKIASAPSLSKP